MPADTNKARVLDVPAPQTEAFRAAYAARVETVEKLRPVVQKATETFTLAVRATLEKMTQPERDSFLIRSDTFFQEALNKASKDMTLICLYSGHEERARQAIEDFLVMRSCQGVVKAMSGR